MNNISNRIKIICEEQSIKISDLEKEVGLSRAAISRWKDELPKSIASLVKISQILNVSTDYLLGINNNSSSNSSSIMELIISKTEDSEIEWRKVGYDKIKNIPSIIKNKYLSEYYNTYVTEFKGNIIIFSYYNYNSSSQFYLWLNKNGEYIDINYRVYEAQKLYNIILNNNKKAINMLLQDLKE